MVVCKRLVVLCVVVLVLVACQGKPQSGQGENVVLAKVNGTSITEGDINFSLPRGHGQPAIGPVGREFLDEVIIEVLMYQQGLKLGLDRDIGYKNYIAKKEHQPARAKWLEMKRRIINTRIAAKIDITPRDAHDYYDKNSDRFATELHLLYIKVKNKEAADAAMKQIQSSASFESVARPLMGGARVHGREPWDLGFVKWDNIPVDFFGALYRLNPGEVSDILGSPQAGFQIVKLAAKRKVYTVTFRAIYGQLMNRLRDLKMLEAYNQYVVQLKQNAKIEKS